MSPFFKAMFIFFLILSPPVVTTKGPNITAMFAAASRLLAGSKPVDYTTTFKPENTKGRKQVFPGKAVDNCMPKGKRHSSAPSHYINYHTFGSTGCDKIDTP
ncbi:Hypothetical predicted protein [Olea europaea subsp. europaea]|uniref:Uncharacterized protein n=1 Tax=Olea europaea subsp. europaea TaxID=158383 RepID=A0A8S0Q3C5_OLEEU|nr:Hypothetical predicted protein [Olea europaea subsp. europaea]